VVRYGGCGFCTLLQSLDMKRACFVVLLFAAANANAQKGAEGAIRQLLHDQTAAWNAGSLEGFMHGYWKSDSLTFIGKSGITHGWQQTLDNYKKSYPDTAAMGTLTFDILEVKKLSGAYYYVTGRWQLKRAADAPSGYFTLLLRQLKGGWKIVSDHSS
jgi:ketosteroid isomerase-like protein